MMKAAVYKEYGQPSKVLKVIDVEKPMLADNKVLVKVHAASINSWDYDLVTGVPRIYRLMFGLLKPKYTIPGIDISGTVEAVGSNIKQFKLGDEVVGDISESGFGAFAEYVCVREKSIVLKPVNMSFEIASTFPHAGGLAFQGLFDTRPIKKGDKVLINGAGGSAGPMAVQMAKLYGAEVSVVDSVDKLQLLQALGADYLIDYKKEDFTKSGKKYDLILELIGKRSIFKYIRSLEPKGILSVAGGTIFTLLQAAFIGRLISSFGSKKLGILMHRPNTTLKSLIDLYEAGKLKPVIDTVYPLKEIAKAVQDLGNGLLKGKVVIKVKD
jgi:NADPH:quinone reductase-like Zn-dependent oxidoreductase